MKRYWSMPLALLAINCFALPLRIIGDAPTTQNSSILFKVSSDVTVDEVDLRVSDGSPVNNKTCNGLSFTASIPGSDITFLASKKYGPDKVGTYTMLINNGASPQFANRITCIEISDMKHEGASVLQTNGTIAETTNCSSGTECKVDSNATPRTLEIAP